MSMQMFLEQAKGFFRNLDPGLINSLKNFDDRRNPFPGHCLCPLDGRRGIGQQSSVPMVFQNPPASFHSVVLAVIRRIVGQVDCQLVPVGELHQTFEELSPHTAERWTIVQIDDDFPDVWIVLFAFFPPLFEAVCDEIARLTRLAEDDREHT